LFALAAVVVTVVAANAMIGGGGGSAQPPRTTAPAAAHATSTTQPTRTSTAAGTASGSRVRPSAYRVGITSLTLDEPATPATATGHSPSGAPIRSLPTLVRYPARGQPGGGAHPGAAPASGFGPYPLVVFSQGYDISAEAYSWLLDAWARAGYVVADPTYPLTDPSGPGGVNEADIINHPGDLHDVISSLLAAGRDPHSVLHGLPNPARVGIVGHSDGGDVSLAVAANSCCRDSVVKAAVILSGAEYSGFGGSYYRQGSPPLLVVQGSADTVNVPGCSAQLYDAAPRPKYYLDVAGAEHQPPYLDPGSDRGGVARTVIAFLDAYLSHRTQRLQTLVRRRTVSSADTLTTAPVAPGTSTSCPGAP
jgi:dienelactone hydrolase